jgi:hypothetical protein
VQISIDASRMRTPGGPGARLGSLALGISLLFVGVGTALAVVGAPDTHGLDHRGPALVQAGGSEPLLLPNGAPGDTTVSFTTIANRGAEPSAVRLYGEVAGGLAPHLALTITRGIGEGATWLPEGGGPVFRGTLATLPNEWSSGVNDGAGWESGEQHTYRIAVTLLEDPAAQGATAHATFRWEARPLG